MIIKKKKNSLFIEKKKECDKKIFKILLLFLIYIICSELLNLIYLFVILYMGNRKLILVFSKWFCFVFLVVVVNGFVLYKYFFCSFVIKIM